MPTLRQPIMRVVTGKRRKVDAIFSSRVVSGNADFFSVSSLTLTLLASATDPFIVDIQGVKVELQADVTLSISDATHNFIWVDNTGALGRVAVPCRYSPTAPGSPASGEHWYDLGQSQMKSWDGAAWQNVRRVFIGYVRADGGAILARYACEPIGISPWDRFRFYGSGADGFLDVSSGTTTVDNFANYSAVVVRGGTLNHSSAATAATTIRSQSVFIVLGSGAVTLDGLGTAGGAGGTGAGTAGSTGGEGGRGGGGGGGTSAGGAGGSGLQNNRLASSGGGTAGTAGGGAGATGSTSIVSPGAGRVDFFIWPQGASGGGGGGDGASAGGSGGAAGGAFEIKSPAFAIASGITLTARGGNASNGPAANRGAGGGGGGGTFTIYFRNNFLSGTFDVAGGGGGSSGGAGSGAGGNGGTGRTSLYQV